MNHSTNRYEIVASEAFHRLSFFFVSKGKINVIKVINYAFVEQSYGVSVYNLGFGDFELQTSQVIDNVATANGDARKVFNTVLQTVPLFFEKFPNEKLMIKGSDSREGFMEKCHLRCTKNCMGNQCRKFNQRIRIYKNFVDRNFESLSSEYQFFGGFVDADGKIFEEEYVPGKEYISVVVVKKNL